MRNSVLATITVVVLLSWAGLVFAASCKSECKQAFAQRAARCSFDHDEELCVKQASDSKGFCNYCCKHFCPVCGDVTGDGVVNIVDAMVIGQSTVGLAELMCR